MWKKKDVIFPILFCIAGWAVMIYAADWLDDRYRISNYLQPIFNKIVDVIKTIVLTVLAVTAAITAFYWFVKIFGPVGHESIVHIQGDCPDPTRYYCNGMCHHCNMVDHSDDKTQI
jgi:hypothetical protein